MVSCKKISTVALSFSTMLWLGFAMAATPDQPYERTHDQHVAEQVWTASGGELKLRFNTDLLDSFGIGVRGIEPAVGQPVEDQEFAVFRIHAGNSLELNAPEGGFDRFVGGSLQVEGGFSIRLRDGNTIAYDRIQLRASRLNGAELELVGNDGRAWLYVNHLMYKMVDDYRDFYVRSADVRVAPALAERIGEPFLTDAYVGELKMLAHVASRPVGFRAPTTEAVLGCPNFHNGTTLLADVLMENYSMSFSRCRQGNGGGTCDGTGADDGQVVFTPSSTLRNTNFANTADVPWYQKFTLSPYDYPYPGNDQHPYLIWNMYRIVDGQLEQIGASGVKHAFLTVNSGCAAGACTGGGHILGKNCGDTYGTGNNDSNSSLGPRNELVASTGYWGRCGSIYDTNCDGSQNNTPNGNYDQRMIVRESQMQVPGAQFYSESWYIVQDDVNIYNTMMHKTMAPAAGGSSWSPGSQGANVLGPLINAWVNPTTSPTQNIEIDDEGGHTRIAVKVKTLATCPAGSGLSGTCYRYDYAVHNFDFSRPVYGNPPNDEPPNLRVVSNLGFGSFSVPVPASVAFLESNHFADSDIDAGNNWTTSFDDDVLTWTAPAGNELDWGMLYRFSFVTNVAPQNDFVGAVSLGVATAGSPSALQGIMMVPNPTGAPTGHVVTASAGAGGSITPPSQVVPDGGNANFTVIPATGHSVAGVTGSTCTPVNNGNGTWTGTNITANCAVTASFSAIQYSVTATGGTGGAITPPSQQVNHGASASFNVSVQTGYRVVSVTGTTCSPSGSGPGTWTAANITANCAVTASFALNEYAVTATAGAGGSITPPNQSITHGGNATFTVTPQANHVVSTVTGSTCTPVDNGNGTWTASNITSACAVSASFEPVEYTVTATAGEGGHITPASQDVAHGGQAEFNVTTEGGFGVITVVGDTCSPQDQGGGTWVAANIVTNCAVTASFSDAIFTNDFEIQPAR